MSSLNQQETEEISGESITNSNDVSPDELKELLQRTQANFENYRKQMEKRVEEIIQMASRNLITQILPILDNFELALQTTKLSSEQSEFLKGITLIHSQLTKIFRDNGVEEINAEGNFNPHIHEALMKVPSELPENTIIEVLQKGYTLHSKLLRPAKVKLSAGKPESKESAKEPMKEQPTKEPQNNQNKKKNTTN